MTVKEAYNIGRYGLRVAFKAKEGTITMTETNPIGGKRIEPKLSAPIQKGDKVKLDGDMTVTKATTGSVVIGEAFANPLDWKIQPTTNYTQAQAVTAELLREVTIETIFKKIIRVKCKSGESIAVGDYLKYGSSNIDEFEEADSASDIIALTAIDSDDEVIAGFK
jgi:hypothetical protein